MNQQDVRNIVLKINDSDVQQKIKNLNTRLESAKKIKEQLENKASSGQSLTAKETADLAKFTKEVNICEKQLNRMRSTKQQVEQALNNLSTAGPKELKNTLKALNKEIESGSIQRGSKEWKQYQEAIEKVNSELRKIKDESKQVESLGSRFSNFIQNTANLYMSITGLVQGYNALRKGVMNTVQAYSDMEEVQADVRKYTGMTDEQVKDLNEDLMKMDTRTSCEQLNKLAGDAGRLGLQSKKDILDFVEAADKIKVALGEDLGEDAVKNIGKLAMLYSGESEGFNLKQSMLATGSAINELAQNSAAAEKYLLEFTARLAGVGKQAGISQADIMGFAAVLDEGMLREEMASTALQQLITKIFQKPAEMAKAAGLEVKSFTELVKNDANAALIQYFETLKSKGGFDSLAPMFKDMELNGQRAIGVLSAISDKIENVKDRQLLANQAYMEATSIDNEFAVKNETVQAALDKAAKKFNQLTVELGYRLLPVAKSLIGTTKMAMVAVKTIIDWLGKHYKTIIALTAAIVTYNIVVRAQIILDKARILLSKELYASIWANITATRLYQAVQQAFAIAQGLVTVAVTLFTKGLTAARIELSLFTTVLKTNPLGLFAIVISTVIGLVLQFTNILGDNNKALEESNKKLDAKKKLSNDINEATKNSNNTYRQEQERIRALTKIVHDNNSSYENRKKAIEMLKKAAPGYHATLTKEGKLTEKNTQAISNYLALLEKKAIAEALYSKFVEAMSKKADAEMAAQAWRKGLNTRIKMMEPLIKAAERQSQYTEDVTGGLTAGFSESAVANLGTSTMNHDALDEHYKHYYQDLAKIAYYDAQAKFQDDYINGLRDYAKSKGALEFLDKAIANGGKIDLDDPGFDGSHVGQTSAGSTNDKTTGKGGRNRNKSDKTDKTNKPDKKKDPVKKAKEELEKKKLAEQLYAQMEYLTKPEVTKQQYEEKLLNIDKKYLEEEQKLYTEGSKEWNEIEMKKYEKQQKIKENNEKWSMRQLEIDEREELEELKNRYADFEMSEKEYQQAVNEVRLLYMKKRADWTKDNNSDNAEQYQKQYSDEMQRQKLAEIKEYEQQANAIRKEFQKKTLEEQEKEELELLNKLVKAKVMSEEEGEKYREEIVEKYNKKIRERNDAEKEKQDKLKGKVKDPIGAFGGGATEAVSQSVITLGEALQNLNAKLKDGKASWEDWAAVAMSSMAVISNMMNSVSSYYQAAQDAETAKIEKKYETEIQRAGSNSRRGKKLEEKKQKEIAAVKNKYNKKMQTIELAQAVASTAMAAINAYASAAKIPMIGHIMAPIAAAMALAAGALQIATIKKQHAAQAAGYYAGGFTGGRDYRREAGIVHQGEFVANHAAVNNPNVLPVLRLIDYAQRNNTVASLTAADVSRAVGANAMTATTIRNASAPVVIDSAQPRTAEALERLNDILAEPIKSYVTIDGNDGVAYNLNRYNKLKARK